MPVTGSGAAQSLRPVWDALRSVSSTDDIGLVSRQAQRRGTAPSLTSAVPEREPPVGGGVSLHVALAHCDRCRAHPAPPTPSSAATECTDTAEVRDLAERRTKRQTKRQTKQKARNLAVSGPAGGRGCGCASGASRSRMNTRTLVAARLDVRAMRLRAIGLLQCGHRHAARTRTSSREGAQVDDVVAGFHDVPFGVGCLVSNRASVPPVVTLRSDERTVKSLY